jgi:hypothetical protein
MTLAVDASSCWANAAMALRGSNAHVDLGAAGAELPTKSFARQPARCPGTRSQARNGQSRANRVRLLPPARRRARTTVHLSTRAEETSLDGPRVESARPRWPRTAAGTAALHVAMHECRAAVRVAVPGAPCRCTDRAVSRPKVFQRMALELHQGEKPAGPSSKRSPLRTAARERRKRPTSWRQAFERERASASSGVPVCARW